MTEKASYIQALTLEQLNMRASAEEEVGICFQQIYLFNLDMHQFIIEFSVPRTCVKMDSVLKNDFQFSFTRQLMLMKVVAE